MLAALEKLRAAAALHLGVRGSSLDDAVVVKTVEALQQEAEFAEEARASAAASEQQLEEAQQQLEAAQQLLKQREEWAGFELEEWRTRLGLPDHASHADVKEAVERLQAQVRRGLLISLFLFFFLCCGLQVFDKV